MTAQQEWAKDRILDLLGLVATCLENKILVSFSDT